MASRPTLRQLRNFAKQGDTIAYYGIPPSNVLGWTIVTNNWAAATWRGEHPKLSPVLASSSVRTHEEFVATLDRPVRKAASVSRARLRRAALFDGWLKIRGLHIRCDLTRWVLAMCPARAVNLSVVCVGARAAHSNQTRWPVIRLTCGEDWRALILPAMSPDADAVRTFEVSRD